MPLLPLGSNNSKNPNTEGATVSELKGDPDPLSEFDEYGTELHREARVWKVYVKETDKYDGDLVKGWNEHVHLFSFASLNTNELVVFAALFSAISSAFLIESSKALQEDPLLIISQTLLLIANGTQLPGSTSPPNNDSTNFTPSRTAVWVNTLWYLSLSLSLATSFIAILAKDWCHSFMKDRTGHPFDQTCRRQKKWDMIVRWKMSELLGFLPSLIHLALLLFAIGLCITLWDTHITVAVPVICVSGVAFGFYVSSSVAASIVDWFPYPTIFSRMFRSKIRQLLWRSLFELPFFFGLALNGLVMVLFAILFSPAVLIESLDFPSRSLGGGIWRHDQRSRLRIMPILRGIMFLPRGAYKGYLWIGESIANVILDKLPKLLKERMPTILQGLRNISKEIILKYRLSKSRTTHGINGVTVQALSWLITYCEVPESVDVALQSVAGATSRISRDPLLDCKAPLQILRRLASTNLYRGQNTKSEAIVSLYVRALSFLGTSVNSNSDNARKEGSELETLIWDLQTESEKKVAALIEEGNFEPTQSNLDSLRIGSTVASKTLKLLQNELGSSDIVPTLDSIAELLKSRLNHSTKLHDAAILSLAHAATLLLLVAPASIAKRQNEVDMPPELLTLCRNFHTLFGEHDQVDAHPLLLQCGELAEQHNSGLIASLATTCILLYNTHEDQTRPQSLAWSEEVVQGLIQRYSQDDVDIRRIYNIDAPGISAPEETYDLSDYISRLDGRLLSNNPPDIPIAQTGRRTSRVLDEKVVSVELHALSSIYNLTSTTRLSPAIYALVVEVMCRTPPSSPLFTCGAQMLSRCPFPTLSEGLATALGQRDLVSLLETTSTSYNRTKRYFTRGQLWLLLSLYIYAGDTAGGRDKLKVQLDKWRRDGGQSREGQHRDLGVQLFRAVLYDETSTRELGIWAWRLEECVRQFYHSRYREDIENALRDTPPELRGLSSFTAWPRRAGNPSTNEPRPVEVKDEARERTDTTNLTTEGEGATGRDGHLQSAGLVVDTEEAGTQGEDDARRANSSQSLEAATQGPPAGDGNSLADANSQEEAGGARGEGNSRVEAVGDERRVADVGDATEATDGPQPEGEETQSEDLTQGEGNEGDVVIRMDRLENRSDGSTTSA